MILVATGMAWLIPLLYYTIHIQVWCSTVCLSWNQLIHEQCVAPVWVDKSVRMITTACSSSSWSWKMLEWFGWPEYDDWGSVFKALILHRYSRIYLDRKDECPLLVNVHHYCWGFFVVAPHTLPEDCVLWFFWASLPEFRSHWLWMTQLSSWHV